MEIYKAKKMLIITSHCALLALFKYELMLCCYLNESRKSNPFDNAKSATNCGYSIRCIKLALVSFFPLIKLKFIAEFLSPVAYKEWQKKHYFFGDDYVSI